MTILIQNFLMNMASLKMVQAIILGLVPREDFLRILQERATDVIINIMMTT